MNKKLLTAAIAAAIAAPTAALANDVTIYGVVHASVDYLNEYDESWRGETYLFDANGNGFWTPAIRDSAGNVTNAYEISQNGVVLYPAPTLAQMASYYNFTDNLRGDKNDGFDVVSRATRLGFKGTEDLANGLKAIWKMEFQIDIADRGGTCGNPGFNDIYSLGSPTINQGNVNGACDTGALVSARNAYIGLAGGWGTFLVGRHDTPYKMTTQKLDLFADTLADNNSTIGFVDIRTNSAIAYVSPAWYGLSFAGAIVAPHVYSYNNSIYTDANNNPYLISKKADADSLAEAYSLAVTWDGYYGLFATVGYENISGEWYDAYLSGGALGALFPGVAASWNNPVYAYGSEDNEKWRVGLGWTGGMMGWGGLTLGGIYEWEDNVLGLDGADAERWQLVAGFTFGNNTIKAMYGQGDFDVSTGFVQGGVAAGVVPPTGAYVENADQDAWAVGFDHAFSKRTKAYILYTAVSGDSRSAYGEFWDAGTGYQQQNGLVQKRDYDAGGFSIGMVHSF